MKVRARLGVHDQALTTGRDVFGGHALGREHHQVGLERQRAVFAGGRDHVGAEGQVRHELAVHHVPLDPVDPGTLEGGHLVTQLGEIGGQHAWGDLDCSRASFQDTGRYQVRRDLQSAAMSIEVRAEKDRRGRRCHRPMADGQVAFVRGALPNELVAIEVVAVEEGLCSRPRSSM